MSAILLSVSFYIAHSVKAAAGINQQISFQGKVVNLDGTNVANGNYTFVFRLYDVASAGTHIWTDTETLTVTDGIFQYNLGSDTGNAPLPGSVDFNTDNIYLGINFNGDGEMDPRVRFTAAPYAFNAKKVGGLTVTNTTGTLTIPDSTTIQFSGANNLTFTTTGATGVTLPTTGTLATLAGVEIFTNKTIGSTGLTFSGAATDMTTGTDENLTFSANGTGDFVFNVDSGTFVSVTGTTDGQAALTIAAGDVTLTDGDLIVTAGDANITLDAADSMNITKSAASGAGAALVLSNTTAASDTAGSEGQDIALTVTQYADDGAADTHVGLDVLVTNNATDAGTDDIVYGIRLQDLGGTTGQSNNEYGFYQAGTGWDYGIYAEDAAHFNSTVNVAGLLTASGGISLPASQSLAAAALAYVDLGLITHSTTANQGLRLPNAASATPSNPTSGEGYIAWDAAGNQLITYNGSAWTTISAGSTLTVRESDASPSVSTVTALEFGPASTSSEEFIVSDQTGGVARVVAGTMIGKLNEAETVTAGWTFNTAATTFTTAINANGGLTTTTTDQNLAFSANGGGDFVFNVDSGTFVSITGTADGQAALTIAAGDLTLTDGDLVVSAGDANFTLDAGDTFNIVKSAASAGDVMNITASSVNAFDGLQFALTATTDSGADNVTGIDLAWTESSDADVWTAINLPNTTSTNSTTRGLVIGTGYDTGISVASGGISIAAGALAVNSDSITSDGTLVINASGTVDVDDILNANSITSDAGVSIAAGNAYTGAGAVTLSSTTNTLTLDSGNNTLTLAASDTALSSSLTSASVGAAFTLSGTSYVRIGDTASPGTATGDDALYVEGAFEVDGTATMDGSIVANAGISLSASQSLAAAALSYIDLGLVVHNTTANQGLRLPNAASATPSNPSSGEGYLAWDAGGNQLITYNGSAWTTLGGGSGYNLIKDESTSLTARTTLAFLGAGVSCADNASQTECTITGGSGSDLQGTYGSDADGSNATISLTAADDGLIITNPSSSGNNLSAFTLQVSQLNTTAAITILDLVQASNAANGIDLTANSIDTETGLNITANALTTGRGLAIASSSAAFTTNGALAYLSYTGASSTGAIFRVDDETSDTSPFVIDPAGNVGIGIVTPATLLEIYGAAASDVISTITSATTTNDPVFKLRTGSSPAVQFSLGVDNSDSDKFKIYSGDGLGLGDEFTIDANGVTSIANLNLGATSFDTDAGIVTWMDMPVTSSAASGTVESYAANIDGNALLTIYGESDGAGAIQDRRVVIGTGAGEDTTTALLALDVKTSASGSDDPTGFEGALYYNDNSNKFRCFQSAAWTDCIGAGGSTDLQTAYATDADGSNATITLNATDESIVISNPSSSGTDSAFVFKTEQLNTGADVDALYIDNRGTGDGLRIDDSSGDTTPFIVDADGRVGIGTAAISGSASTERLLQVGSETKRGNSATYGEVISKGLNRHTALTNIKDIYVYDTTGDSDGGRWIDWATTDNLSWYSETLDDGPNDPCNIASDDRCYNSSFPRKAILVVTTNALYIFDAATNDMWMKFSQNASVYALGADTNNDPSSVHALNGVIYVGANGTSAGGLYAIDFVNDRMWNYNGTDRSAADVGISGRNAAVAYNVDSNVKLEISPTGTQAEWERVNDVHAVVMSRTQSAVTALGAQTANTNPGYGKVFIGLATDSGITLINPSGQVLHQYSDVTADDYTSVVVSSRGFLYALNTTQDQLERWDTIDTDKASEINGTFNRKWDETIGTGPALASAAFNIIAGAPDNLEIAERASNNLNTEDVVYVGHSLGMAELHEHTTQAFGWVKYYNATRQTPMMMLAGINDMVLPMDDTSGTQAQDLAIANTDMAIKGTPTLGVNGVQGKAINFDNTDDYLCSDANQDNTCDVDTAFNMSTVGWTISLWFRHSTTAPSGSVDTIFEKCVTAAPVAAVGCVIAYMNTNGTITVANDATTTWTRPDGGTGAVYDITATSTYAYNDNQWHNLIITRSNAIDVDSWIDGQGMTLSTATHQTATFDASQIVSIGASCVLTVTANCGAVVNVWDGQIDDVQYIVGTTTQATMTQLYVRRYFNVERPRASKKTITVTDATSASSTSLTDTGEAWYVNEFAGQIVEITGSSDTDCVGITRRISANTATSLTFTPAVPGACTMDTSADFQIDPEKLYGASSSVAGIGITAETPLGEARQLCVGTNSGSDTGGVTCYNHQDGPSIVADVYHSQSSHTDDSGTDWTGTDYDDIRAVDLSSRTLVMASEGHFTSRTEDVRLGQGLEYVSNQLYAIRQEIVLDGITALGSMGSEIGFTGGADLAEHYYSNEPLAAGEVVSIDKSLSAGVKKTSVAYQKDALGIVATEPGIVLGSGADNSYPIALVGRVPVKVTNENGPIYAGDRLTASSRPGYAMRAIQSGRVVGEALGDAVDWTVCEGEDFNDINAKLCTTVMVFVNLTDYSGQSVELAMAERNQGDASLGADGLSDTAAADASEQGLSSDGQSIRLAKSIETKQERILDFLKDLKKRQEESNQAPSEVFTGRLAASSEVITPALFADQIFAKSIKADSIEGLQIWTNEISNLSEKYAGLAATVENGKTDTEVADVSNMLEGATFGNVQVTFALSVLGQLSANGGIVIGGPAEFNGDTVFNKLASFFDKTIFKETVSFEKTPVFNSDTAGFAVIAAGQKSVDVTFDEAYIKQPIVSVTLTSDESALLEDAATDAQLAQDIEATEKDFTESIFESGVQYIVTKKGNNGFTITLNKKAPRELQFSWVAFSVENSKTFHSEENGDEEESQEEILIEPVPPPLEETALPAPEVEEVTETPPQTASATENTP